MKDAYSDTSEFQEGEVRTQGIKATYYVIA